MVAVTPSAHVSHTLVHLSHTPSRPFVPAQPAADVADALVRAALTHCRFPAGPGAVDALLGRVLRDDLGVDRAALLAGGCVSGRSGRCMRAMLLSYCYDEGAHGALGACTG